MTKIYHVDFVNHKVLSYPETEAAVSEVLEQAEAELTKLARLLADPCMGGDGFTGNFNEPGIAQYDEIDELCPEPEELPE